MDEMTDDEIKEFVDKVRFGQIYLLDTEEKIKFGALPIIMGAFKDTPKEEIEKIGMVYGDMDDATPRCINGIPGFWKVGFILKDEWAKIADYWKRVEEASDKVPIQTPAT